MIKFKNLPDSDKPRERLFMYGSDSLSNEELLSIIIKTGTKNYSVKEVSLKLLEYVGDIENFKEIGINSLMKIDGIGRVKAIEIKAALEFGRRVYLYNSKMEQVLLNSSDIIYNYFSALLLDKKQEYFYCVYVDTKSKYIDKKCLFIGTINSSIVHPREVFKEAYLLGAVAIICIHNHPSGNPIPSREDYDITNTLIEVGKILGIKVLDHIIICKENYYSFLENNDICF
jgi:DNA repair protein RadC